MAEMPAPWRRLRDNWPSSACTLSLPIVVTDGRIEWRTTTNKLATEADFGCPIWWRHVEASDGGWRTRRRPDHD